MGRRAMGSIKARPTRWSRLKKPPRDELEELCLTSVMILILSKRILLIFCTNAGFYTNIY
jgi:hypothetical protein